MNILITINKKYIKQVNILLNSIQYSNTNEELFHTLKKQYKNTKNIVILPFTDKISDYMKASDIILSKPGGLTTTEMATLRKPFIHTMPIPGCENYNANFFDKRKMAIKCDTIEEVVSYDMRKGKG